ncbi:MAG: hypothetical protein O3B73_15315 [bacterium]|nr:hypothetical protein [bacterium]
MEDLEHRGSVPSEALAFFREHRQALRSLRRVLVEEDNTSVVDINGACIKLFGLGRLDRELVELLKMVGASYDPATVHRMPGGNQVTKIFDVIKSDPWGHDRVA